MAKPADKRYLFSIWHLNLPVMNNAKKISVGLNICCSMVERFSQQRYLASSIYQQLSQEYKSAFFLSDIKKISLLSLYFRHILEVREKRKINCLYVWSYLSTVYRNRVGGLMLQSTANGICELSSISGQDILYSLRGHSMSIHQDITPTDTKLLEIWHKCSPSWVRKMCQIILC